MKPILVYLPYEILRAALGLLPALIVLNAGGSAIHIGMLAALSSFCNMMGGFFWPRYLKAANRASVIIMGYLGLFLGLVLMNQPRLVFPATAVVQFFPLAIFYAVMSAMKNSEVLGSSLGRFFRFTSMAAAVGYTIGLVGTSLVAPQTLAMFLAFGALASIPFVATTIGEEGLAQLLDGGMTEFKRMGSLLTCGRIRLPRFDFGREQLPFLFTSAIFSICFGMVFSQRANVVKSWFGLDWPVYAFMLIDIFFSILVYGVAGRFEGRGLRIGHTLLVFCLLCFLAALHWFSIPLLVIVYILSGLFWPFINIFYSAYGLGISEELLGANLSIRSTFYILGSLTSGYFIEQWGFFWTFAVALGIVIFAPLPFLRGNRDKALNDE